MQQDPTPSGKLLEKLLTTYQKKTQKPALTTYVRGTAPAEPQIFRRALFAVPRTVAKSQLTKEPDHPETVYYELPFEQKTTDGKKEAGLWRVVINPGLGIPGSLERDVFLCTLKLWEDRKHLNVEGREWIYTTLPDMAKILGRAWGGKTVKEIIKAVNTNQSTLYQTSLWYDAESRQWQRLRKNKWYSFQLFRDVQYDLSYSGEDVVGGTLFIELHPGIVKHLKAFYCRPIDLDYYFSLKDHTARAIYCLVTYSFYNMAPNQRNVPRDCESFCKLLWIKPRKYFSDTKRVFIKAFKELQKTGFLDRNLVLEDFFKASPTDPAKGWLMFYPGDRGRYPERFYLEPVQEFLFPVTDAQVEAEELDRFVKQVKVTDIVKQAIKNFYSGLSARKTSINEPTQEEIRRGTDFYHRIEEIYSDDPEAIREKFTAFGEFVRKQQRDIDESRKTLFFNGALKAYGDRFLKELQKIKEEEKEHAKYDKEEQDYKRLRPTKYLAYLKTEEKRLQTEQPELLTQFKEKIEKNQYLAKTGYSDLWYYEQFQKDFAKSGVLDFWDWYAKKWQKNQ